MNSRLGGNWKLELGLEGWNKPGITFGENESGEVPSGVAVQEKFGIQFFNSIRENRK